MRGRHCSCCLLLLRRPRGARSGHVGGFAAAGQSADCSVNFAHPGRIVLGQPPVGVPERILEPDPGLSAELRRAHQALCLLCTKGTDHPVKAQVFGLLQRLEVSLKRVAVPGTVGIAALNEDNLMLIAADQPGAAGVGKGARLMRGIEDVLNSDAVLRRPVIEIPAAGQSSGLRTISRSPTDT